MATRSTVPKTLIRTVINEDQKDAIVAAIVGSAKGHGEGAIGDGKIFVSQVEDAVRVRTGDHGAAAI
jgi:nitrogen regulatory protein PII